MFKIIIVIGYILHMHIVAYEYMVISLLEYKLVTKLQIEKFRTTLPFITAILEYHRTLKFIFKS